MRYLLCGINAKYIHSNLAVLSLKAYCEKRTLERDAWKGTAGLPGHGQGDGTVHEKEILIREYTINHYVDDILQDLYEARADVIIFSCYIWNIDYVTELAGELRKIAPDCSVWAGGPEVSYDSRRFLQDHPAVDLVMCGEGEEVFYQLTECYDGSMASIPGLAGVTIRREDAHVEDNGFAPLMDMDRLPFVYDDFSSFAHKILYYETSRGCPFSCSYCLSSIDKRVRFRSMSKVKQELDAFLAARVAQVKFVDRTFNCDVERAKEIWAYLTHHDNGVTNFHFEISSDILDDACIDLFRQMRPGLIQLEIGVQSTNPPTLDAIHRRVDFEKLFLRVDQVHALGNIHQHLDLIAGLPYEDYERFSHSFDHVYAHIPDQLQLGFLKVLKGTRMMEESPDYRIRYRDRSPYEVLSTRWLSYDDVIRLKGIEELVELYYNSGQYTHTLSYVVPMFESPFLFYESFSRYYRGHDLHKRNHNRLQKYEILRDFLNGNDKDMPLLDELLLYDLYLRENVKSRPGWAPDLSPYKKKWKEIYRTRRDLICPDIPGEDYDSRYLANHSHMERFSFDICTFVKEGIHKPGMYDCIFDYTCRNPLNQEARSLCYAVEE